MTVIEDSLVKEGLNKEWEGHDTAWIEIYYSVENDLIFIQEGTTNTTVGSVNLLKRQEASPWSCPDGTWWVIMTWQIIRGKCSFQADLWF
jgi:hypothetical protein